MSNRKAARASSTQGCPVHSIKGAVMYMQVDASVPLFGYIGRLEEQKGVDILIAALPKALQNSNIQVAILGTGEARPDPPKLLPQSADTAEQRQILGKGSVLALKIRVPESCFAWTLAQWDLPPQAVGTVLAAVIRVIISVMFALSFWLVIQYPAYAAMPPCRNSGFF